MSRRLTLQERIHDQQDHLLAVELDDVVRSENILDEFREKRTALAAVDGSLRDRADLAIRALNGLGLQIGENLNKLQPRVERTPIGDYQRNKWLKEACDIDVSIKRITANYMLTVLPVIDEILETDRRLRARPVIDLTGNPPRRMMSMNIMMFG